ncbi:hypothetical protein DL768_003439 [Monosporascus sp. mg162]|nr:hypothetical protein DL768_003439 [Monosporascus sp. mg162]
MGKSPPQMRNILYAVDHPDLALQFSPLAGRARSDFHETDRSAGYFLDSSYTIERSVLVERNDSKLDPDEFHVAGGGDVFLYATRCAETWEVDRKKGGTVFQWTAHDHINRTESTYTGTSENSDIDPPEWTSDQPWDPFTPTAINLISVRHMDSIMLVSGRGGSVIWRLGRKNSNFVMEGVGFSQQHHASYMSYATECSVLGNSDNASGPRDSNVKPVSTAFPAAFIVQLDHAGGKPIRARLLGHFDCPDMAYTETSSSVQVLPNHNVFVSWWIAGYPSEHAENGELLMEAYFLKDRFSTHRAYKFDNWAGAPRQKPEIKTVGYNANDTGVAAVYVSWNGATKVAAWDVYVRSPYVGSANRTAFETVRGRPPSPVQGLTGYVHFASRLTGWNAVKVQVSRLGLEMTTKSKNTAKIKALADVRPIAIDDADSIIRSFHVSMNGPRENGVPESPLVA